MKKLILFIVITCIIYTISSLYFEYIFNRPVNEIYILLGGIAVACFAIAYFIYVTNLLIKIFKI